ncbi:unnamed protein product [Brassica rapa]|uniref:BED-type domain-containing protein n=2 Tax=Brassica TaxID=3705 RepID=A0A8D9CUJ6_BRACM|nr:unnamed protein product [Brassica napus]CAG7862854.1 unnamed protein product [Brassica rapa]
MSAYEDKIDDDQPEEGHESQAGGKKRPASERSSTELPPPTKKKQIHRAEVWQHFIQREDDPSIAICRYFGQDIGSDSKKSGTSAMKNHISRCKLHELF